MMEALNLNGIVWNSPWAFLLFLPLAAVLIWQMLRHREKHPSLQFSSLQVLKDAKPSLRVRLKWLPYALTLAFVSIAILALARPQRPHSKVKHSTEGIDIVLALDISDSMMIEDMDPMSRIDAAKKTLSDFVKKRPDDRIGLVAFKGEAFTRVPMTMDHELLLKNIQLLDPNNRNMRDGTAIGSALATSVARLRDSTAKSRVIVLATDGENNMGMIDPETALEIAKGYGIRIYTIGMGKDGESMMPVYVDDPFGRRTKRYQAIHSSVNDDLLGKMAKETGGQYYRATAGQALDKVFNAIDRLEKSKIDSKTFTNYEELFPQFLILAVALWLAGLLLQGTWLRRLP